MVIINIIRACRLDIFSVFFIVVVVVTDTTPLGGSLTRSTFLEAVEGMNHLWLVPTRGKFL